MAEMQAKLESMEAQQPFLRPRPLRRRRPHRPAAGTS